MKVIGEHRLEGDELDDADAAIREAKLDPDTFEVTVSPEEPVNRSGIYRIRYQVSIRHVPSDMTVTYQGGHEKAWVAEFAHDLARGDFPHPKHARP